jgi:hypothetical protein
LRANVLASCAIVPITTAQQAARAGFQRERAAHQGIEAAVAQDPNGLGRRQHDKRSAARPGDRSPLIAIEWLLW